MATLKKDLRQRHLEAFELAYGEKYDVENRKRIVHMAGGVVLSAIDAGWLDGLTAEDVPDMTAKDVRKLAQEINDLYGELTKIDPK